MNFEKHSMNDSSCKASRLLLHINLLLMLFGGAGLATAARLKWDPSTYIVLREVFPREYHVGAITLTVTSLTLVLLGHLALLATFASNLYRRPLLLLYAILMVALAVVEVLWSGWTLVRIINWLRSNEGQRLLQALLVKTYYVQPVLGKLGKWLPMSRRAKDLMDEADADTPRNLYVGVGAAMLLAILQSLAVVLALKFALARIPHARSLPHELSTSTSKCTYWKVSLRKS